ncbi:tail protein X [Novosphingobium sp. UBA1939]|uniref:tail protein X n=1 Tax=Novosphingobium sp. UBA1939 TaxID=1946982 RepID=UPI0025D578C0|nr:tail protein X [Novosphingobium sp. UBA1939]
MPSVVRACQGDTLDLICWRTLGTTAGGIVEQAYELNRGLADSGVILAEGTMVTLPDPPASNAATLETVNLWN